MLGDLNANFSPILFSRNHMETALFYPSFAISSVVRFSIFSALNSKSKDCEQFVSDALGRPALEVCPRSLKLEQSALPLRNNHTHCMQYCSIMSYCTVRFA